MTGVGTSDGTSVEYTYYDDGSVDEVVLDGTTVKVTSYEYDEDDRLVEVAEGATVVVEYGYDVFGRRVMAKRPGESVETFFYDREDVVQELTGSTTPTVNKSFVHGPGIDDYVGMAPPGGRNQVPPAGAFDSSAAFQCRGRRRRPPFEVPLGTADKNLLITPPWIGRTYGT